MLKKVEFFLSKGTKWCQSVDRSNPYVGKVASSEQAPLKHGRPDLEKCFVRQNFVPPAEIKNLWGVVYLTWWHKESPSNPNLIRFVCTEKSMKDLMN
jgi:hypothetical protein